MTGLFPLHRSVLILCLGMGLLLTPLGCQRNSSDNMMLEDAETDVTDESTETEEEKTGWPGRWLLVISEGTMDYHPVLLEIKNIGGRPALQIMEAGSQPEFQKWGLKAAGFNEDNIQLGFETSGPRLIFQGQLHGDVILGSLYPEGQPTPTVARLERTPLTTLSKLETPRPVEGVELLQKALESEKPQVGLREFIEKSPNNPLVHMAYKILLSEEVQDKVSLEEVQKLTDEMATQVARWGTDLTPDAYFEIIRRTLPDQQYRPVVTKYLTELKKILGPEPQEVLQERLDLVEGQYLLFSESAEDQQAGLKMLNELLANQPFEFNAILAQAKYYEQEDQADKALPLYTKLAVLPGISRSIVRIPDPQTGQLISVIDKSRSLWKGTEAEFQNYLDEIYEQSVYYFKEQRDEKLILPENRRVPFLELFTGAMCPPCVAGDLAVGAIEQVYPAPEIIVVRYHQHIPGPDPLTSPDGEGRYNYYNAQGTPALMVNGRPWENIGGMVMDASDRYAELAPHVKSLLGQSSPITIDLKASLENGTLKVAATAHQISTTRSEVRLRLVVVTPLVHYVATNGIRVHEMVARSMPGGPGGIAAQGGKAEFQEEISLSELEQKLKKEIETFQKNRNFKFDAIPVTLDQVRVIAFVQDDTTKQVLQSTISPVLGQSVTNKTESAEPQPKATTPAEKAPATPAEPAAPTEKEQPKPEMPAPEKPATETPVPEKSATETPPAEKSGSEKTAPENNEEQKTEPEPPATPAPESTPESQPEPKPETTPESTPEPASEEKESPSAE